VNAVHRTSLQPLRNLLLGVTSSIKGEARAGLSRGQFNSWARLAMLVIFLGITAKFALAADTGTISGTVSDPQGSVVPGVTVQLTAVETGVIQNVETDGAGFYRFPALPLGHYDITFSKAGFEKFETKGLLIDVDSALHADATLKVGSTSEQVTVTTTEAQVETESAQIGQVIGGKEMEDIPLDGRAYTDLLALQPGVVPFNASLFGVIGPQNGTLNAGALDISGGQETHNGYMVNGANVVEGYEGGTFLIPVLDSIAEFRIITADANAEYGNYSGGLVNVVT